MIRGTVLGCVHALVMFVSSRKLQMKRNIYTNEVTLKGSCMVLIAYILLLITEPSTH